MDFPPEYQNPTFKHPLAESLVNATFTTPKERKLLMKGMTQLPTSKQHLAYTEHALKETKKTLAKLQQDIADLEFVIATAKILAVVTNDAEGDDLVDFHGQ